MSIGLLLSAAIAATPPPGMPVPVETDEHYDLEVLYHEEKHEDGLARTLEKLKTDPQDPDLYWHYVRFQFEIAERFSRTDKSLDKEAHYQDMADWADKGLAIDPDNAHLLFAKGIALGRLGTTRGVLSSLFLAQDVESVWLKSSKSDYAYSSIGAEEVLPCDVYLTLGIFYRLVPESRIVQMIAGTRGDMQKSVDYQKKADQCGPNRIGIVKELAVSQICFGQKRDDEQSIKDGVANLSRGLALVPHDASEKTDIKHMSMILANPNMACGYSRDGQQDLDESQLDAQAAGN
jgi:hypothetical protein